MLRLQKFETMIRRTAIIGVDPSETIHGVKAKIQDQRWTRSGRLRHQKDASTLHLVLHIQRMFIKKLTGETLVLKDESPDTIRSWQGW